MSLPTHLHPTTYWEKRCELLEESVERLAVILCQYVPSHAIAEHMRDWNRLLDELTSEHPPAPQTPESQP